MRYILSCMFCILLFGCATKEKKSDQIVTSAGDSTTLSKFQNSESYLVLDSYLVSEVNNSNDVHTIDSTCAVFIYPTEEQSDQMEKENGEDFYTIADDAGFYQAQAASILDSLHIKSINAKETRYLRFKGANKEWVLDIRQKGAPAWNLIFFDINKTPHIISAVTMNEDSVSHYFMK